MDGSNISNREYYRLHGVLTSERIEQLLDTSDTEYFIAYLNHIASETENSILGREQFSELHRIVEKLSSEAGGDEKLLMTIEELTREIYRIEGAAGHSNDAAERAIQMMSEWGD